MKRISRNQGWIMMGISQSRPTWSSIKTEEIRSYKFLGLHKNYQSNEENHETYDITQQLGNYLLELMEPIIVTQDNGIYDKLIIIIFLKVMDFLGCPSKLN